MDFGRLQEALERRTKWRASNSSPKPYTPSEGRASYIDNTEGVIKAKRSGPQNLKRDGWSEDKCRAYLVKHTQFIPRNYNYSDGLRLLGPLLQYAFGDENGDVALGIVWEFIEIERDPPYPEALFQKWKFKHLHRHEDLMLPHVPHANTISLPVVITDRLRKWRAQQSSQATASLQMEQTISQPGGSWTLQRLPDHIPASAYKKLYPNWREDAIFTSAGGQVATPYLPKQEVIHKMRWNEQHGRGGKLQSTRTLTVEDLMKEKVQQDQEEVPSSLSIRRSLSRHLKHNLGKAKAIQSTPIEEDNAAPRALFSELLPNSIPNANFARKFGLIPPEQTLEGHQILEQKTACQKQIESDQELWEKAWEAARECRAGAGLDTSVDAAKLFSDATSNYNCQPLTPSLFYDSWNDFDFGPDKANHGLKPPILEDTDDGYSEQSIQIFHGEHGFDTSCCGTMGSQSPSFMKNVETDGRLESNQRLPFDQEDLFHHASDLPLRNFLAPLPSRTMRTDLVLGGASGGLLTLSASIFDPIHVRAVYSMDIFEPTAPLLGMLGLYRRESTALDDIGKISEKKPGSFFGHSRTSTCCSETIPAFYQTLSRDEAPCSKSSEGRVAPPWEAYPDSKLFSEKLDYAYGEKEHILKDLEVCVSSPKPFPSVEQSAQYDIESAPPVVVLPMSGEQKTIPLGAQSISPKSHSVAAAVLLPDDSRKHDIFLARAPTNLSPEVALEQNTSPCRVQQQESLKDFFASIEKRPSPEGVANQFCEPEAALKLFIHNKTYINSNKGESPDDNYNVSMDTNRGLPHYLLDLGPVQAPPPLQIIKQSIPNQPDFNKNTPVAYQPTGPVHPPRSSSVKRRDNQDRHKIIHREGESQRVQSEIATVESVSTLSSCSGRSTYAKYDKSSPSEATAQAERFLSESSTNILGDFVAINTNKKMANPFTGKERNRAPYNSQYAGGSSRVVPNPYEFEPGSPYDNLARQTTFTNFIDSRNGAISSPRQQHVKNAYSVGDAKTSARPNSLEIHIPAPTGHRLHRSESSPSVVPGRFPEHQRRTPSPDIIDSYYYGAHDKPAMLSMSGGSSQRGRQVNNDVAYRERQNQYQGQMAQSPTRSLRSQPIEARGSIELTYRGRQQANINARSPSRLRAGPARDSDSKSARGRQSGRESGPQSSRKQQYPVEPYEQSQGGADKKTSTSTHQRTNSAGKNLTVTGVKDYEDQYESPIIEPKKRSRSPMKKMFGHGGWLGNSPSEANTFKMAAAQKAANEKKQDSSAKTSVMGKIRNKLEEFAEKADISPARNGPSKSSNKTSKIAILAVSIGPPEQARIYMELELMLVHTANTFLMNQFRQGRIAIDSIKKTFDNWKSKGRPSVVEFMYDQGTQRELISVNQHNFRFHGERALDGIRVHSMLYNWKVVASHMSIRTFCNADTVILKLIFDIEQILELLGAAEGILLRLQNIRLSVNEKILITRKKRDSQTAEKFVNGRQVSYDSRNTSEDVSLRGASGDPYGGLKLVPDFYADEQS